MLSRIERFEQWRGDSASEEKVFLDTALLMADYVERIDSLGSIKADFATINSEQFVRLNQYSVRPLGALIYCKFIIAESLEENTVEFIQERRLFETINDVLDVIFDDPRKHALANIGSLINNTQAILSINIDEIADKQKAKLRCFAVYTMCSILNLEIAKLSGVLKMLVTSLVDLTKIKKDIALIMTQVEEMLVRLDQCEKELAHTQKNSNTIPKTVQQQFNDRFIKVLATDEPNHVKVTKILINTDELIEHLSGLINAREQQIELAGISDKVRGFLWSVEENNRKVRGRKYFLDLMNEHIEPFNLIMNSTSAFQKEQLNGKIERLKNPTAFEKMSSNVLYGISWVTSLFTVAYRWGVPQTIQKSIAAKLPVTLDSQCKSSIQELAREYQVSLRAQTDEVNKKINEKNQLLSHGTPELTKLICKESTEELKVLLQAYNQIKTSVTEYKRLSSLLKEKANQLAPLQNTHHILGEFIKHHDGWLVKLSNFLAQLWPVFKTDTAAMIDSARELQNKLHQFEMGYKNEMSDKINEISAHPVLPNEIKSTLKKSFAMHHPSPRNHPRAVIYEKDDVRALIASTTSFFNADHQVVEPKVHTFCFAPEQVQPSTLLI